MEETIIRAFTDFSQSLKINAKIGVVKKSIHQRTFFGTMGPAPV
jgi:hypothetical protein